MTVHKSGNFAGEDTYFTPVVGETVDAILRTADIEPEHKEMVGLSIAETLSHLATENEIAKSALLSEPRGDIGGPLIDTLSRLEKDEATVHDKLLLLGSNLCPKTVRSLELARCHHFLENRSEDEQRMAWLVAEGMARFGIERAEEPELHKIKLQGAYTDRATGQVTGAIISMKEDISSDEATVALRHRRKAYIDVAKLGELIAPHDGYGGTMEAQLLQVQRQLKGNRGSCLRPNTQTAINIVRYMSEHPEHLITSIYYAFRTNEARGDDETASVSRSLGAATVRSAVL